MARHRALSITAPCVLALGCKPLPAEELGIELVPMEEDLARQHTWESPSIAWTLDGGEILIPRQGAEGDRLQAVDARTGRTRLVASGLDTPQNIKVSSDDRVYVWQQPSDGPDGLFRVDLVGGEPELVFRGEYGHYALSPSGAALAVSTDREIVLLDLEEETEVVLDDVFDGLTPPYPQARALSFSPDGSELGLWSSWTGTGGSPLAQLRLADGHREATMERAGDGILGLQWTEGHMEIVHLAHTRNGPQLEAFDTTGETRVLTEVAEEDFYVDGASHRAYAPDGSMAVVWTAGECMRTEMEECGQFAPKLCRVCTLHRFDLVALDIASGTTSFLATTTSDEPFPHTPSMAFSPSGDRLAFVAQGALRLVEVP